MEVHVMAKDKKVNKVVKVLMSRDNMSRDEAEHYLQNVYKEIDEALAEDDYGLVEDIVYSELGLEMDYIFDILY
jgi:polyhydroxyalkanoate synthesis regulator phasin